MRGVTEPSVSVESTAPTEGVNAQRERIRIAAVQLFTRQGFAGTSMKQLAQALDTVPGNIYNYYTNKESILLDVLEYQLVNVAARDREILARDATPTEKLQTLAYDLVVNDLSDPLAAFVGIQGVRGLSPDNLKYVSGLMADIRGMWVQVIAQGVEDGAFEAKDPKFCTLSILTLCSSVSTWYQTGGEYSAEYVAENVAALALKMAAAPQTRAW